MADKVEEIKARAESLPTGIRSDWRDTNHYELSTPGEPFWLCFQEDLELLFGGAPVNWSATDTGRRLGLVMDIFAAYGPDMAWLIAEIERLRAENAELTRAATANFALAAAEAGVMRKTLEEIAASTAGDDEPGDRSPRRAGWECVQRARAALASDAGEKAAAVIAAAVEHSKWCGPGGQDIERTLMQRETRNRLRDAVAAMEKGDG